MEIQIELSLCINFFLNACIIKSTALFLKEKSRLFLVSALIGAVVALIVPLCHLNVIFKILVQIFLSALMVSISFSFKDIKKFFMIYGSFLGITFIFGGGCYAVEQLCGQLPLCCVFIVAGVIYAVTYFILKARNRKRTIENFSYKVRLTLDGKAIEEEGFLDSGNVLYDPVTKKPIVLVSYDIFAKFYDVNYLTAYMKKVDTKSVKCGHYIKINSVASGTSILAFTADKLEVLSDQPRTYDNITLGLSFSGFEKSLGRKVLLHSELI